MKFARRRRLAALVFLHCCLLSARSRAEVLHFDVKVSEERKAQASLLLPDGLRPGTRLPVLLVFGGFESAGHVLELIHPHKPVALASFDYPFSAPRHLELPGSLGALPEARRLYPGTLRGIHELLLALEQRPEIDARDITAVGASFGAPFVVAAAAQEVAIGGVVLVHAFGRIPETAEGVVLRSWLPRYGWAARPASWLLTRLLWLYLGVDAPETWAARLRDGQRVLMITALNDSFVPRESSDALWDAISKSPAQARRIVMATDHLMPGSERLIDEIIREIERWRDGP